VGLWHDIKVRLGLEEEWEEEYEDEYEGEYGDSDDSGDSDDDFYGRRVYESAYGSRSTGVRRLEREADAERARRADRDLRPVPSGNVAAMAPQVKMHIVEPKSYGEVQSIADKFKQGTPVIMNMTLTQPDTAKRLIDFASGLTYGLDGGLQKIADRVFMLTPANVDVSAGDFRHLKEKGLFTLE